MHAASNAQRLVDMSASTASAYEQDSTIETSADSSMEHGYHDDAHHIGLHRPALSECWLWMGKHDLVTWFINSVPGTNAAAALKEWINRCMSQNVAMGPCENGDLVLRVEDAVAPLSPNHPGTRTTPLGAYPLICPGPANTTCNLPKPHKDRSYAAHAW